MSDLQLAKKKLEIKQIEVGKQELEYKILEKLEDIERLKKNIEASVAAMDKVNKEIEKLNNN